MRPLHLSSLILILAAAGCNSTGDLRKHGISTPTSSGNFKEVRKDGQQLKRRWANRYGDGYAFEAGLNANDDGFAAFAGILPNTDLGAVPTSGSATMTGHYEAAAIQDIRVSSQRYDGDLWAYRGDMTVKANFDSGKIDGRSSDGRLDVDGRIKRDGSFAGSSTFNGVDGDLAGVVDSDTAVGAFAGGNDETIFAGGFYVED